MMVHVAGRLLALATVAVRCIAASELPAQHVFTTGLDEPAASHLNFSSPSPLIFHSTFALLFQWTNTIFGNGHTIAPCTIPQSTNFYHAQVGPDVPDSPEWFAFDSSMAYSILGGLSDSHLFTYRTTRDVQCLYFDGTSATLMTGGSMDSQMLLIHNSSANVPGDGPWGRPVGPPGGGGDGRSRNPLQAEYDRASGLCDFIREKNLGGPGWGFEGVIRMNAAFELIWCNFTSPSAKLISRLNVSAPAYDSVDQRSLDLAIGIEAMDGPPGRGPGGPRRGGPGGGGPPGGGPGGFFGRRNVAFQHRSAYEWFHAAVKTYGFHGSIPGPGESRAKIDSCGIFSFYDPALTDQESARVAEERKSLNLTVDGAWQRPTDEEAAQLALRDLRRRRRPQRARNVSSSDGGLMLESVEANMRRLLDPDRSCSGLDWVATTRTIVSDYSAEIYELRALLSNATDLSRGSDVLDWLEYLRGLAHQLYMPFYEYAPDTKVAPRSAFHLQAPNSRAAFQRCRSQHDPIDAELSAAETVIFDAVSDILAAVCSVLLPVFLSTEQLWLEHFNNASALPSMTSDLQRTIREMTTTNLHSTEELMAWLGWEDQWVGCSPGCDPGQVCAIPIWPVFGIGHFTNIREGGRNPFNGEPGWEDGYWEPHCVDAEHLK